MPNTSNLPCKFKYNTEYCGSFSFECSCDTAQQMSYLLKGLTQDLNSMGIAVPAVPWVSTGGRWVDVYRGNNVVISANTP